MADLSVNIDTEDDPDGELRVPLSVLDLATVSEGATSSSALADTVAFAKRADELGYLRFWVAEHHNMETVASTSPSVLIAHLASVTNTIAVGSGGVMLPNHAPLAIAEQFALLEALHPGRIDLGIGRAPGSDPGTAAALRRTDSLSAEDFPRDLLDVMGLLGDVRTEHGLWERFRATPSATSAPRVMLLGSSDYSARLAGMLGLPFAFANHFDTGGTLQAVDIYRNEFRASSILDEPYTMVSAGVIAADSDEEGDRLANPSRIRKFGMRTGRISPLVSPEAALSHPHLEPARAMPSNGFFGSVETVVEGLGALAAKTAATELMIQCPTHTLEQRLHSIDLIASAWGQGS